VRLIVSLALAAIAAVTSAQQHVFPGKYLDTPPKIDGVVTEAEWGAVPTYSGGYDEATGAPDPYGSQYWLAYDKNFIYVAARLTDPDPKLIHATEFRQNVSLQGDDNFLVEIDPFSTLSDINQFEVNPNGATDVFIAGGRAAKREWLGAFHARARITPTGWEAEAAIPWSIMRLPSAGRRDLRVTFGRFVFRTQRIYDLDNLSINAAANFGIWKDVDVPKADTTRIFNLLPYVYGGAGSGGTIANAGLDLKAPITQDLDFVGSVNPDFRNIENQVLSIDFSYFERLAGESRPFFLEGASYFRTSLDAPLFASQRIADFDTGAKVYGKLGDKSTFAMLDTVDLGHQNDLVAAYTYNFSAHMSAKAAFTDLEAPGAGNFGSFLSLQADNGPTGVFFQHETTTDASEGNGHRYNAGVFTSGKGLMNDLEYLEISPHFLPRLGFAPETDLRGFTDFLDYEHPAHRGAISDTEVDFGFNLLRTFEGTNYRKSVSLSGSLATKDGLGISLGGAAIDFEQFRDREITLQLTRPRNDPYRNATLGLVYGEIAGSPYFSLSPSVNYRPFQHFQLAASYERVSHVDLEEQTIVSANYDINASDSVSCRAIRQGSQTDFYFAYRRTGNRGNEYYLIIGDPNAPTFRTSVILKAVIPIELKF